MKTARSLWRQWAPWLLLALLAASLVPVLLVGRYSWPSADDYSYAYLTHEALLKGSGFWGEVWHTMWGYYKSWQGTFSALGLMSLTPVTFSEGLYWLTPVVMVGSVCLGTFKLTDTIVRRWLGGSWRETICVAAPLLLLTIHFVPAPKDAFYWWNGAVYYTFTYGIMLLLIERMAALTLARTRPQLLWAVLPALPLAFLVGGSNYVSALLAVLVCGLFLLGLLLWKRERFLPALLPSLVLAVCFLASVAAPGNQVRQSYSEPPIGAVPAIVLSILKAGQDCLDWPNWPILAVFALMIPVVWRLTGKVKFSFPLPLLFSVFSFLLFAAQNAPHFYAMGVSGPGRLRSIVYYAFCWLLLANLWYWLGWLRRTAVGERALRLPQWALPCGAALVLAAGLILGWAALRSSTAGQAAAALSDGSAQGYWSEQMARLAVLQDPAVTDAQLPALEHKPPLLYNTDITSDPTNWINRAVADFYHKNTVQLAP